MQPKCLVKQNTIVCDRLFLSMFFLSFFLERIIKLPPFSMTKINSSTYVVKHLPLCTAFQQCHFESNHLLCKRVQLIFAPPGQAWQWCASKFKYHNPTPNSDLAKDHASESMNGKKCAVCNFLHICLLFSLMMRSESFVCHA